MIEPLIKESLKSENILTDFSRLWETESVYITNFGHLSNNADSFWQTPGMRCPKDSWVIWSVRGSCWRSVSSVRRRSRTFGYNRTCSGTRRPYSSHARTSEKWEAKMTVCENNTVVDVDQLIDIPRFNGNFHFRTTISNTEYLVSRSMKLNWFIVIQKINDR